MLQCLLIDESLTIQKAIRVALSDYDVNVTCTASLQEAIKLVGSQKPDIIISDASLDGKARAEDFKRLSIQAHSSCLFLKGSYQSIDEEKFKEEGFFHFLQKPFEASQLVQEIENILKKPLPQKEGLSSTPGAFGSSDDTRSSQDLAEDTLGNSEISTVLTPEDSYPVSEEIPISSAAMQEKISIKELQQDLDNERQIPVPPPFTPSEPQVQPPVPGSVTGSNLPPLPPRVGRTPRPNEAFMSFKEELKLQENRLSSKPENFNSFDDKTQSTVLPPPPPPLRKDSYERNSSYNDFNSINFSSPAGSPPPFTPESPFPSTDVGFSGPFSSPGSNPDTLSNLPSSSSSSSEVDMEQTLKKLVDQYLQAELPNILQEVVQSYCRTNFSKLARQVISEKIDKLLEDKASLKNY